MQFQIAFAPYTPADTSSATLFSLVYGGFIGMVNNPNRAANIEDTRSAVQVLDAIEAVTDLSNANTAEETRSLKPAGGVLILSERALALLKKTTDAFVATAPYAIARLALQCKDMVDGATVYVSATTHD